MLERRARFRGSGLERLEARGLLSVLAPIKSVRIDPTDNDGSAAEVGSSAATRQAAHSTSPGPAGSGLNGLGRTPKSSPGNLPASTPVVRNNPVASGALRRSTPADPTPRDVPDPLSLVRHNEPATGGDSASNEQETMSVLGGSAFDPVGSASLVGWAPGTAMPVVMALANPPDRLAGFDGRASAGPGSSAAITSPTGSVAYIAPGAETLEVVASDVSAVTSLRGGEFGPLSIAGTAPDGGASSPAWADLIDGALRSDWEGVEGDLRQFLARLGGLADATDGPAWGPAWPLCIAATTALVLAHRASYGPRRLFRRPVAAAALTSGHGPVPVGPWPLGPP
jgi:hypothetical protein